MLATSLDQLSWYMTILKHKGTRYCTSEKKLSRTGKSKVVTTIQSPVVCNCVFSVVLAISKIPVRTEIKVVFSDSWPFRTFQILFSELRQP